MRGRKPKPAALGGSKALEGPEPPDALPRCPAHLSDVARKEWRRLAKPLGDMGILSVADRAALAAYCQVWARWVEAEEQLQKTPPLLKTPSGYVQQSPWLSIANKQLEIMGRYMAELGLTPSSRTRLPAEPARDDQTLKINFVTVYEDKNGQLRERPFDPGHRDRPGAIPREIKNA